MEAGEISFLRTCDSSSTLISAGCIPPKGTSYHYAYASIMDKTENCFLRTQPCPAFWGACCHLGVEEGWDVQNVSPFFVSGRWRGTRWPGLEIAFVFHKPALTHPAACCGFCIASIPLVGHRPFKCNTTFKIVPAERKKRRKHEHSSVFFRLFLAECKTTLSWTWECSLYKKKHSQGQEPMDVSKNIQEDEKHYGDTEWPWRGHSHVMVLHLLLIYDEWQLLHECDSV